VAFEDNELAGLLLGWTGVLITIVEGYFDKASSNVAVATPLQNFLGIGTPDDVVVFLSQAEAEHDRV